MPDAVPDIWSDPRLWVSIVAAVLTLCAVLVALFLRELRAWWRPPVLRMDLANANGSLVTVNLVPSGGGALALASAREEKSRYYHLRVSNPRRKADAVNGAHVTLLRVERKGSDGAYHEFWSGDVPLTWRNEQPETRSRVIGTRADADLCHVVRGKWLGLGLRSPFPIEFAEPFRAADAPFDLIVTIQARGNEVDSEEQRWRIVWDGKWEDGELEMRKHFSVEPVKAPRDGASVEVGFGLDGAKITFRR